jgi:DNA-binding transcriptional ArsR family regulator
MWCQLRISRGELWILHAHRIRLFKTLADPTRRAIFERLTRDGEQTVRALTDQAGVSQPAVSKHLESVRKVDY